MAGNRIYMERNLSSNKGKHNYYPVFNFKWVPLYLENKRANLIRNWIKTYSFLSNDVEEFISACDYDLEGSLIAYTILLHICGVDSLNLAKRLRYSTLTDQDLNKAWYNMQKLDYPISDRV